MPSPFVAPRLPRICASFILFAVGLALFMCLLCENTARAQFGFGGGKQVTPGLLADTAAVKAGKPFTAAVRLKMIPGWHVYTQFPGDSGQPPVINWSLPEGFKAGPIQWPIPTAHLDDGDMLTYIYENEVLLMVEITPPADLPAGDVTLKAAINWLVCEKSCVPGRGQAELKLPVGEAAPANAEVFAQWRAQIPKDEAPPFQVKWDRSKPKEFSVHLEGIPADVKAEFFPLPPGDAKPGQPKVSEIAANGARTITFPIVEGAAPNLAWRGVLATGKGDAPRQGWVIAAEADKQAANVPPAPTAGSETASAGGSASSSPASSSPAPTGASPTLAWALFAAFVGGLILNVMPCVLPVIALKIYGFVHQASQDPSRIFRLGLAFTAGVFTFFMGLATAVALLKSAFNWGYVLQNPYSLSAVIALIFAFSLNLLGVFEVALSGGAATKLDELSRHEGLGGAFLHGLFTTLLGTSCTAPFLTASLGFATTQPVPIIYLIFLFIAAGMSLPYFLLTARPVWLKYVPKPGMWMERVKQFMGFVMLAVGVWLFGVLSFHGGEVAAAMGWFLLVVGLGCWVIGTWNESGLARVAFVGIVVLGYFGFLRGPLAEASTPTASDNTKTARIVRTGSITWQPYTEEALAAARAAGQPVFVDFTAEWCVNCKVYEKAVLATDKVGAKFAEKNVLPLRADWTNTNDPVVTKALKSFNVVGVPLYVIYRPGEKEPVTAAGLTTGWLLGELDKITN